ncbi:MAG: NTF2-like N-terminal transpeptidase domain-containing protein [Chloroflexota bacterium]
MRLLWGMMLLLVSWLLVGCSDNLLPADIAQRYLELVRDSSFSQAYDLLSTDSQLKISRNEFVDRLNRAKLEASISRTEILKVNRDPVIVGQRASVTYQIEVTIYSGQKMPLFEALVLLQQEGGWRIVWPPQ